MNKSELRLIIIQTVSLRIESETGTVYLSEVMNNSVFQAQSFTIIVNLSLFISNKSGINLKITVFVFLMSVIIPGTFDVHFRYGTGSFSLSDIISGVTASFNTEFQLQEVSEMKI